MIDAKKWLSSPKEERQAHIKLDEDCVERGGNSTNHRGVLAEHLNTNIPAGRVILAHACGNRDCSNPRHLYWATDRENIVEDGKTFGTHVSPWQHMVNKYGYKKACEINRRGDKTAGGKAGKGRAKTMQQKRKTSVTLRLKALFKISQELHDEGPIAQELPRGVDIQPYDKTAWCAKVEEFKSFIKDDLQVPDHMYNACIDIFDNAAPGIQLHNLRRMLVEYIETQ